MKRHHFWPAFFFTALWGFSATFWGNPSKSGRIKIMTSVFPLKEFASAVAGERGEVDLLLPPGSGVHTWQPRAGDLLKLAECDVFISIGADLEPWAKDMMRGLSANSIRTMEASKGLELAEMPSRDRPRAHDGHGTYDPHIWLDFGMDEQIIDRIEEMLTFLDPQGAPVFQKNAKKYKERLRLLDEKYRNQLNACEQKTMILAGHAAFGYLARRYGFKQVALYGLSPDAQPTPREVIDVIGLARQCGAKVIFYETSASPALARTLARELRARTLVLNTGHNLTSEEIKKHLSFFDIMEENLRMLRNGLGCL